MRRKKGRRITKGVNVAKRMPVVVVAVLLNAVVICDADVNEPAKADEGDSIGQRDTLTGRWFGLTDGLADKGIEVGTSATQIYQQNTSGGISTHRRAGRYSGSYDVGNCRPILRNCLAWTGGRLYMLSEGKWSKSGGINDPAVGSFFNVNGDGAPRRAIDVTELWYEQNFAAQETSFAELAK